MKILRTAEEVIQAKENERIANIGCDKCPYCKNTTEIKSYKETWHHYEGDGYYAVMHRDYYKCMNCSAIWQSEEYQGLDEFVFAGK